MAKANDNLPAPDKPATHTKLSSKALPFQPSFGFTSASFTKPSSELTHRYPANVDLCKGDSSSKPSSEPTHRYPADVGLYEGSLSKPTRLGRFLPASAFVGFVPSPNQILAPAPLDETWLDERNDFASEPDYTRTTDSGHGILETVLAMLAEGVGGGAVERSSGATAPTSGDAQCTPSLEHGCPEEPASDIGDHSPSSPRGEVPVRNTFIHFSVRDDREIHMLRCSTAPAIMTEKEVHSKYPAMELAHIRGQCRPCYYFLKKRDGCRWGGDCTFCHLCPAESTQRKKRERLKLIAAQDCFEKRHDPVSRKGRLGS